MPRPTILDITVTPKSSKNRLEIQEGNRLKAHLTAPPSEGRANQALIALLSKALKVPKSSIEILHGRSGRKKLLKINDLAREEIFARISDAESR